MNTLVINYLGREKRYALLVNQKLEKMVIEQPSQQSSVGNIYLGIVTRVLPGMNAAFVDIGEEKAAYLHRDKLASFISAKEENKSISSYVHQGERLLVQIEKDATGTKGPRVTGIIELPGESLIYLPNGRYVAVSKKLEAEREKWESFSSSVKKVEEGIIIRTETGNRTEEEVLEELEQLRNQYEQINKQSKSIKKPSLLYQKDLFFHQIVEEMKKLSEGKIFVDQLDFKKKLEEANKNSKIHTHFYGNKENIFSAHQIEHEVEKALKRMVWLSNGAYLVFDETEALTIIDVNTGKFSGKNDLQETVFKTNLLAAEEIARQVRLRDLAGMILIDFIDMKNEQDRMQIQKKMQNELNKDERRTKIIGFTPLGILQLTRKKTKVSISEALQTKCPVCEGKGKILSPESICFQMERELLELKNSDYEAILIETTEEVKAIFSGEKDVHKNRLEELLGIKIFFIIKNAVKPYFEVRKMGTESELKL